MPIALAAMLVQDKTQASLAVDKTVLPAPNAEQNLALETLNGFRAIHGLEPMQIDRRLLASAALHSKSMAGLKKLEHKGGDKETADVKKRAEAFGFEGPVAELIGSGLPSAPYAVVSFMDAPYHRRLLLKPGNLWFGCAGNDGFVCVVLGGQAEQRLVFSPPHGSEGVPTTWDGREEPSPMRGTSYPAPYGYPITLAAYGYEPGLKLTSATLSAGGAKVDCIIRDPANDEESRDQVIIVPVKPLAAKTVHTVSARFAIGEETHSETWSFRTGADTTPVKKQKRKKGA